MKKTTIYGFLALMVVGLVLSTGIASAYRGDSTVQGPNFSEERHELMEEAFGSLDYEAWETLMTEDGRHPRVLDLVTEENFEVFAQAHEAMLNGDHETASELRAELGLNNGQGPRDGSGHRGSQGKMDGNCPRFSN